MANTSDIVQSLQHVPLFQESGEPPPLRSWPGVLSIATILRATSMVTQGQGGEGFFVLTSGKAEAVRTRADGEKVVVNSFGPGSFFGEMALLDAGIRTATVTALEPTDCLVLRHEDFIGLLKEDGEMAVIVLQELAKRFRIALDRLQ